MEAQEKNIFTYVKADGSVPFNETKDKNVGWVKRSETQHNTNYKQLPEPYLTVISDHWSLN